MWLHISSQCAQPFWNTGSAVYKESAYVTKLQGWQSAMSQHKPSDCRVGGLKNVNISLLDIVEYPGPVPVKLFKLSEHLPNPNMNINSSYLIRGLARRPGRGSGTFAFMRISSKALRSAVSWCCIKILSDRSPTSNRSISRCLPRSGPQRSRLSIVHVKSMRRECGLRTYCQYYPSVSTMARTCRCDFSNRHHLHNDKNPLKTIGRM
ncbi:uncharacterized protein F5147DRAFT_76573 [Suillus discolor]|uniref:Uncharacterized protein n=1 Tax=Suillus discolor TaxID=1912936 RepID=A0A9P7ERT8_9AGAM|nr:uncharacterized protein F5147DRAFT_76573 [Suillus discolor]KAG2086598.1 hypothetical protein F5147DRAFT_76573 [Suillus discolor]